MRQYEIWWAELRVVNCDNLRTVSKVHLVEKIAKLSPKRVPELKRALGYALAWEELIAAGEVVGPG